MLKKRNRKENQKTKSINRKFDIMNAVVLISMESEKQELTVSIKQTLNNLYLYDLHFDLEANF